MNKSIEELQDFKGSLKQLKYITDNLVKEFGENSLVEFDAGYNNVDVIVKTEKFNIKEDIYCKFSLFRLERRYHKGLDYIGTAGSIIIERCFEYIKTYDTLDEAKIAQKELKQKSIILPSY